MGRFNKPIPGQSLTTEPGNAPWEQPPKFSDPEEALDWHLQKYNDPDVIEDLVFMLDQGLPVSTIVETVTSKAVMEGYHSPDVSLLIQPIMHEQYKRIAESAGVKYREWGGPTPEQKKKDKMKQRFGMLLTADGDGVMPESTPSPTNMKDISPPAQEQPLIQRRK